MDKNSFKIIKTIFKWVVLLAVMAIFWTFLSFTNPNWRFAIVIFVVLYLLFDFRKQLFPFVFSSLIMAKKTLMQQSEEESIEIDESIETEDPVCAEDSLETEEETEEEEEEEQSTTQKLIFVGSIVLSCIFLCLIAGIYCYNQNLERDIARQTVNMDTSMEPIQFYAEEKPEFVKIVNKTNYYIKPLANYKIAGVIIAKNTFLLFDGARSLAPIDLGLAWGDMAKPENYKKVMFFSGFRILQLFYPPDFPLSADYVNTHQSHNHLIPATDRIKDELMRLNNGQSVVLEGSLVEVTAAKMPPWRSSLRRDDNLMNSGAGCEIFYVEKVTRI